MLSLLDILSILECKGICLYLICWRAGKPRECLTSLLHQHRRVLTRVFNPFSNPYVCLLLHFQAIANAILSAMEEGLSQGLAQGFGDMEDRISAQIDLLSDAVDRGFGEILDGLSSLRTRVDILNEALKECAQQVGFPFLHLFLLGC
jgi:hypothetical protein